MPGLAALARRPVRDVLAGETDRPGCRRQHAHDRLDELGLAVALDAGDADDLAPVDLEADVVDHCAAVGRAHGEVLDRELDGRR